MRVSLVVALLAVSVGMSTAQTGLEILEKLLTSWTFNPFYGQPFFTLKETTYLLQLTRTVTYKQSISIQVNVTVTVNTTVTVNRTTVVTETQSSRRKRQTGGPSCERKDIRLWTKEEIAKLRSALNTMANTIPDAATGRNQYMLLVLQHRFAEAPAAHRGLAFPAWHREFLFRFEQALQLIDPSLCLPYWDSQLDRPLPDPRHSILWSDELYGNNDGPVTSGLVSNWPLVDGCGQNGENVLRRDAELNTLSTAKDFLFDQTKVDNVLRRTNYADFACVSCNFEGYHGEVHVFVRGQMADLSCSPSDPVFWQHHAYVDCLWEEFRRDYQTGNPETDYDNNPTLSAIPDHDPQRPMRPFNGLTNIDGLRPVYTRDFYSCAPRPSSVSCTSSEQCGSRFLFCHSGKCTSMVRPDGNCEGLSNEACYGENYLCLNNVCTTCSSSSDCGDSSKFCHENQCKPRLDAGESCADLPADACKDEAPCGGSGLCESSDNNPCSSCLSTQFCKDGVCEDKVGPGEACDSNDGCTSPSTCEAGTCSTPCSDSSECGPTQFCQSGNCADKLTDGQSCSASEECQAPSMCSESVCQTVSCQTNDDCQPDGFCKDVMCQPKKGTGESCDSNDACTSPDTCKDSICKTPCSESSSCAAGQFCKVDTCEDKNGVDQPCSSEEECLDILTCEEGVCKDKRESPGGASHSFSGTIYLLLLMLPLFWLAVV